MTLKYPGTDIDFVVSPAYFVADFDVYDREEDLGEWLNRFDPNNKSELRALLKENLLSGGAQNYESAHKAELLRVLGNALADRAYDFDSLASSERNPDEYFTLPSKWVIKRPRMLFEEAYWVIYEAWAEEVRKAGYEVTDPRELEIDHEK